MTHTSDKHFTDEELELVARGKEDGMYMKAPNGSPTSLNEKQWAQVRTGTFKSWFGNWENAPEAASRIVDDIRFRRSITAVRPPSGISTMPLPEPVKGRRPTDGGHT